MPRSKDISSAEGTCGSALTSIEICAGAGGQAYGLELAGFQHQALVENDPWCCATLRARPRWRQTVREIDLHEWTAQNFEGIDLFAGGVPCPPFSRAGKRLGPLDDRDLFPRAIELIHECKPRAVLFENVRGLLGPRFKPYREEEIDRPLRELGYEPMWEVLQASEFGVPQGRQRAIMVALRPSAAAAFSWPEPDGGPTPSVGRALRREMGSLGWQGAAEWASRATGFAPTLVGGSKKHGGPDLGPSNAKQRWAELGVNGHRVADKPPGPSWNGDPPILTVKMAAILQGFPPSWPFQGSRTNAYRQVGNAFPPTVAEAVGGAIAAALQPGAKKPPRRGENLTLAIPR